jgi:hypothetical protein
VGFQRQLFHYLLGMAAENDDFTLAVAQLPACLYQVVHALEGRSNSLRSKEDEAAVLW